MFNFTKTLSIHLSIDPSQTVVLPLLKVSKPTLTLSIDEASTFLHTELKNFLFKTYHDQSSQLDRAIQIIDTYFIALKNESLYDSMDHIRRIQNCVTTLASFLLTSSSESTMPSDTLFQELFFAINHRACVDEHAYNLNSLLIQLSFYQFSPFIRKILQHIHKKMEDQIFYQMLSLDHTIFRGFHDLQTSHSVHILHIILDDVFKIAGGNLSQDHDILIERTRLARDILSAVFHNKLTVQFLLSESGQNWKESLASEMSCLPSRIGSIPISILEISQSTDFLNFLTSHSIISTEQKIFLEHIETIPDNHELTFLKPLVTISTTFGSEKTVFTPFFSELILQFIMEKLYINQNAVSPSSSQFTPYINKPLPENIHKKIITQFTCLDKKCYYGYQDIAVAMQDRDSEFQKPFLKPFVSIAMLMMAHCHPKDAKRVYRQWILPNKTTYWAQNCLLIMGSCNHESILSIGFNVFTSKNFEDKKTNHTLLQKLIKHHPQTVTDWLKKKYISSKIICRTLSPKNNTLLHLLAEYHCNILNQWIEMGLISIHDIVKTRDPHGNSVLHRVARYSSMLLDTIVDRKLLTVPEIIGIRNNYNQSVAHCLAQYNGMILNTWIEKSLYSVYRLIKIKDNKRNTIAHWLAQHNPEILVLWVEKGYIDPRLIVCIQSDDGNSIAHVLAEHNPRILEAWVKKNYITVQELIYIKNRTGNSVIHWLSQHSPQTLECWVEQELTTIFALLQEKTNYNHTICFFLKSSSPATLEKWHLTPSSHFQISNNYLEKINNNC